MKTRRAKWFWILTGVILAALAGYALRPKPVLVDGAAVTRGPLRVTIDEEGRTRIRDRYVVAAPLAGQLRRIELKAGDAVLSGQTVLAVIEAGDPALLDPRVRAETEARVKAATAAREQARHNLERSRVVHELAQKEWERARKLAQDKVISEQELDTADIRERSTREAWKASQYAENITAFELEQAQAALLRIRPLASGEDEAVGRFEIRAPVSGRVLRVLQESSIPVIPGTPLLAIGDPLNLEVEVDVRSSDAVRIKTGARVLLERWGGQHPLTGRVRLVEPSGFTKVSALGVEEQRVWVMIDFVDPPESRAPLGDAYRVEARIVIWESEDILKVPSSALFRHGQNWAVYVLDNGKARLRTIKVGHNEGIEAEVLEGLTTGVQVVTHPGDNIRDGVSATTRQREAK